MASASANIPCFPCQFFKSGCEANFASLEMVQNHMINCVHGALSTCKMPVCANNPKTLNFIDSTSLVEHARLKHQLPTPSSTVGVNLLEVNIPLEILHPDVGEYKSMVLAKYNVELGKISIPVALYLITRDAGPGTNEPELHLATLKLQQERNDDLFVMGFRIIGSSQNEIFRLPPSATTNREPFVINAFHSEHDLIRSLNSNAVARISRDQVLRHGITTLDNLSVKLWIQCYPNALSCRILRDSSKNVQPYANSWDEIGLMEQIRTNLDDGNKPVPYLCSRILCPQVKAGTDILVESSNEKSAASPIIGSILDGVLKLKESNLSEGRLSCKALVLVPTKTLIRKYSWIWMAQARSTILVVNPMSHIDESFLRNIKEHGADVIITSPSVLHQAIQMNDSIFWNMLTSKQSYLHMHYASRFRDHLDIMEEFVRKIGPKINTITKTAFDHLISPRVQQFLYSKVFLTRALHFRIGANPFQAVLSNVKVPNPIPETAEAKSNFVCQTIAGDFRQYRRWLVLVRSQNDAELRILTSTIRQTFPRKSLSVLNNADQIMSNPNAAFESFLNSLDSILIAQFNILDFDEIQASEGIILFESPCDFGVFIRICQRKTNNDGSHRLIYALHDI